MKHTLSILLFILFLFGCGEKRVLIDELTNIGTKKSPIMFYEGEVFNGVGFDVWENGQLQLEGNYKDGKRID